MAKRLQKDDWINCGLKSLEENGFNSLKVGPLSQMIGVSRGSFYWHFTDIAEFELQLMSAWKRRTTESVITELESDSSAQSRLIKLVSLAMSTDLNLDKAMRSWSMEDGRANEIVGQVDEQRIVYLESLLTEIGITKKDVALRARILYWSSVGRSVVQGKAKFEFKSADIKRLIQVFLN